MTAIPKILIVDDHEANLIALEIIFRDMDFEFTRATSGQESLKLILKHEFDLVLMDVQMPDMDGFETVSMIRQDSKNALLPIIFVSAICTDDCHKIKGIETGAVDFIAKPVNPGILRGKVNVFLRLKQAENELRDSQGKLEIQVQERTSQLAKANAENKQILESIPSILFSINENDEVVKCNKASKIIFGIDKKDEIRKVVSQCKLASDAAKIIESISECRQKQEQIFLDDMIVEHQDGQERLIGLSVIPVINTKSESIPSDIIILGADLTKRKALEARLNQAQKLEAIGQLAAGIAHEINTPMQYIGDNTHFVYECFNDIIGLLEEFSGLIAAVENGVVDAEFLKKVKAEIAKADMDYIVKEIPTAIEQTMEGITRVSEIVRTMKEFAHPGSDQMQEININTAIESTITVARHEWKYVAEMETDLDSTLPMVKCLPGEINQVLLNMIVNAAHAIPEATGDNIEKGTIAISTRKKDDWLEIRISDTGTGIPEEIREKIFDPFFTTKEVGKGTGQGLSIAHNVIVVKHKGTIHCQSQPGQGTTFIIELPLDCSVGKYGKELVDVC